MKGTGKIPLLPLRGMVVFPSMIIHLDAGRARSVAAIEQAMLAERRIFLVAQKDAEIEEPTPDDLFGMGTIAEIRQIFKLPGGALRVLVEGIARARVQRVRVLEKYDEAEILQLRDEFVPSMEMEALTRGVVHRFEEWVKAARKIPAEALVSVAIIEDSGRLADLIASHLNLTVEDKQILLDLVDVADRMRKLYAFLVHELEVLAIESKLGSEVRQQMEKLQKEYYLREKIKVIQKELGDQDGRQAAIEEYKKRLKEKKYPETVRKTVEKEIRRLEGMSGYSAETAVIRTYVDCLLDLPWEDTTEDTIQIKKASRILEKDHYGLKKVKERILDYLAVHKLIHDKESDKDARGKAPILCLVGPPGVGKTSLASSVARAIGRKFTRASLGGIRDEAEIRGHRRTYVGAMAGRVMEGIRRAGVKNPLFLLDEVDKLSHDYQGDPAAALLEVLDPEQNCTFTDHYVDLPFDLSDVFWIVTANDMGGIPRALRDRMEIITLSSYTEQEKLEIAKRYLLPRQKKENGLTADELSIGVAAIRRVITAYTREAGVRELERKLGEICRKAARRIVEDGEARVQVAAKELEDFLGRPKYIHSKAEKEPQIGVVTGMAWTELGGDILPTEVAIVKGKGELILTGQLGDVMKESAQAGLSYIRSRAERFAIPEDFYEKNDIHIHLPEGAVPKDGPSAGITMATAMVSALTNRKVRSDVAMTGEITLRGRVLPIGGLKEKVLAAYREGMHTIILPKDNIRDIEEIPKTIRERIQFVPVTSMDEVLSHVWVAP
ncbi:MAG: endopeptidase La [Selenomonadaceae bacterium]|nr:endopeptidase La [Selenomonadaceae bacterium]